MDTLLVTRITNLSRNDLLTEALEFPSAEVYALYGAALERWLASRPDPTRPETLHAPVEIPEAPPGVMLEVHDDPTARILSILVPFEDLPERRYADHYGHKLPTSRRPERRRPRVTAPGPRGVFDQEAS